MKVAIEVASRASPALLAWFFKLCLEGMVLLNREALRRGVPRLYDSGVRYQEEPPGVETLRDAVVTASLGHGDCAHLAAWRCAELQNLGENASIRITAQPSRLKPNTRIYHVLVRRGNPLKDLVGFHEMVRAGHIEYVDQGYIEDPSKVLGMGRIL